MKFHFTKQVITPTINVAERKNKTWLIIDAINNENSDEVIPDWIFIYLNKIMGKIIRGKI